jgi:hypothetical protein
MGGRVIPESVAELSGICSTCQKLDSVFSENDSKILLVTLNIVKKNLPNKFIPYNL